MPIYPFSNLLLDIHPRVDSQRRRKGESAAGSRITEEARTLEMYRKEG